MEILEALELLQRYVVDIAIIGFEFVGIFVLIVTGLKGIQNYVKKDSRLRLNLATGMASGLEFMLGGEILRTIIAHEFSQIATVGGIIVLRVALTLLIHWEIKAEKAEEREEHMLETAASAEHLSVKSNSKENEHE